MSTQLKGFTQSDSIKRHISSKNSFLPRVSHLPYSYQQAVYHCDEDEPRQTTHCIRKTSIPSQHVLKGMPEERRVFIVSHLIRCLGVSGPGSERSALYLMSLCFLVVYRWSLFSPPRALEHPSVGSVPPHPSVGLHHGSYKSVTHAFSAVPSSESEPITTVNVFFRSLPPPVRPLRIISSTAARNRASPHLTAVASGALSEQDDGELI